MAEDRLENLENTVKELKAEIEKLKKNLNLMEMLLHHLRGDVTIIALGGTPEGYEGGRG
ncbi:MAG TPA: hypothetical protein VMW95_02900 [Desulfobacterales bacterium]|nr:hypothetical protein [Desulfobacterales bacterium]